MNFRDAAGLNDKDMGSYIANLGRLGFVWQFITLGGLHANALATGKNKTNKQKHGFKFKLI
jgi:isocitrate lyase